MWTVSAVRMKAGREHRVPLSDRALVILEDAAKARTGDFVFAGQKAGKPLSGEAMEMVMRRMNIPGQQPTASDRVLETGPAKRHCSRVRSPRRLFLAGTAANSMLWPLLEDGGPERMTHQPTPTNRAG